MRENLLESPRLESQDLELKGLENLLTDKEVVNRYLTCTSYNVYKIVIVVH